MSCHFLFQGIFPAQGLNPRLLGLLLGRIILYPWATWEAKPEITSFKSNLLLNHKVKESSTVWWTPQQSPSSCPCLFLKLPCSTRRRPTGHNFSHYSGCSEDASRLLCCDSWEPLSVTHYISRVWEGREADLDTIYCVSALKLLQLCQTYV